MDATKTVLVTGASSGIGLALITLLLSKKYKVVATARHCESLDSLLNKYPQTLKILEFDISDRQATIDAFASMDIEKIDVAVLNAGVCKLSPRLKIDLDELETHFKTNVFGTMYCVEAVRPYLEKSTAPLIMVNCSISAFLPLSNFATYGASKAAMRYLLEAIRGDLKQQGIDLSLVYPGYVKSQITDQFNFPLPFMVTSKHAAQKMHRAIRRHSRELYFPKFVAIMTKFAAYLPLFIRNQINNNMAKDRG